MFGVRSLGAVSFGILSAGGVWLWGVWRRCIAEIECHDILAVPDGEGDFAADADEAVRIPAGFFKEVCREFDSAGIRLGGAACDAGSEELKRRRIWEVIVPAFFGVSVSERAVETHVDDAHGGDACLRERAFEVDIDEEPAGGDGDGHAAVPERRCVEAGVWRCGGHGGSDGHCEGLFGASVWIEDLDEVSGAESRCDRGEWNGGESFEDRTGRDAEDGCFGVECGAAAFGDAFTGGGACDAGDGHAVGIGVDIGEDGCLDHLDFIW